MLTSELKLVWGVRATMRSGSQIEKEFRNERKFNEFIRTMDSEGAVLMEMWEGGFVGEPCEVFIKDCGIEA